MIDCYSIKPIDRRGLNQAARETGRLITAEDHYPEGGLGEAVASVLPPTVRLRVLAVRRMPHSGAPDKLYQEQGLDKAGIKAAVREVLEPARPGVQPELCKDYPCSQPVNRKTTHLTELRRPTIRQVAGPTRFPGGCGADPPPGPRLRLSAASAPGWPPNPRTRTGDRSG